MKGRKLTISILLCFIFLKCTAQTSTALGLKAGTCVPNLKNGKTGNPVSSGWSSRSGAVAGIIFDINFSDKIALRTELNYSSEGGKKNGMQAIATSNFGSQLPPGTPKYVYANYQTIVKLNYLELPVMFNYKIPVAGNVYFFVNGGPYVALLLSAKSISSGTDKIYKDPQRTEPLINQSVSFDQNMNVKNDIRKFNAGLQGGCGFALVINRSNIFFTAGGNYGMIPIQKNKDNGSNNIGALIITAGYTFSL